MHFETTWQITILLPRLVIRNNMTGTPVGNLSFLLVLKILILFFLYFFDRISNQSNEFFSVPFKFCKCGTWGCLHGPHVFLQVEHWRIELLYKKFYQEWVSLLLDFSSSSFYFWQKLVYFTYKNCRYSWKSGTPCSSFSTKIKVQMGCPLLLIGVLGAL